MKGRLSVRPFGRWTVLAALCMALATEVQGAFEGREILRRPDMCNVDTVDTVAWYSQESVRLEVEPWRCGKRVEIPEGATAAWVVADEGGTNWIVRYAAPSSNRCAFALGAGEGALPSEHEYTGFVSLLRGTNILGVVDRHEVRVMGQAADGGSEISPEGGCWGSLLERVAEAERDIAGIAGDLATNALEIAELEEGVQSLESAVQSLYGETAGGYRWPDYFTVEGVEAGVAPGTVTNAASATQEVYNVRVETVADSRLKGWRIDTSIVRQQDWEDGVVWEALEGGIAPEDLEVEGDVVHFAEGVESVDGSFAAVRGTLGGYAVEMELAFDASRQATTSTVRRFAGPAAGSLLAACWETVLGAASNGYAAGKSVALRTWPEGYGTYKHNTNIVQAGWNTNFWGAGLGDFSCISYWSQGPDGWDCGVYRPITMVTPRHGIVANHYKPPVGSNCCWVTRGGGVVTNRVVDYRRVRGDLTVARLETAFSTNDVAPAKLLGNGWHSYLYGAAEAVSGLFGVPVIGYDCAERGYVTPWMPTALNRGRGAGVGDDGTFGLGLSSPDIPFFRRNPVGGDSGSPVFWPIDGNTVLIGCWHTTGGGPLPTKAEVDEAIEAWGDEERCAEYDLGRGGWENPDAPGAPGM